MPQEDWIVYQIETLSRFLATMFLRREPDTIQIVDEQGYVTEEGVLWAKLSGMLRRGELNAAEDLLFKEAPRYSPTTALAVAKRFYLALARMSDAELSRHGFSREEIPEGLADFGRLLGKD